ncbi:unnamed protein product [Closterium sp. NIES-64]|nr:unnamed protein product [Closterium sp. NIES-64]
MAPEHTTHLRREDSTRIKPSPSACSPRHGELLLHAAAVAQKASAAATAAAPPASAGRAANPQRSPASRAAARSGASAGATAGVAEATRRCRPPRTPSPPSRNTSHAPQNSLLSLLPLCFPPLFPLPIPPPAFSMALLSAAPPPPPAAGGYPLRKSLVPGVVSQYNYQEVQAATQSFSTEIGRGGFGVVFHGRLADPQGGPAHEVAVKLMAEDHITNGIDSFIVRAVHGTEVGVMARVHHPNILRLEGYVVGATPILIYDYVSMGDASTYLAKAARGEVAFTWKQRVVVALGCAEALTTIHANNFVHRDFKTTNVLLRQDLTPVVADFGLARAVDDWKTHVQTRVMGSMGYIDPIYFDSGMLSFKSDTYAFGIFLLELVSGCSALDARFKDLRKLVTAKDFPDPTLVVDPQLQGQWQLKQVLVAFTLIKFAILFDWEHRPGMDVLCDKLKNLINDIVRVSLNRSPSTWLACCHSACPPPTIAACIQHALFHRLVASSPPTLLPSFPPPLLPSSPPTLLPSFPPPLLHSSPPLLPSSTPRLPSFPPPLLPSFPPPLLPSSPPLSPVQAPPFPPASAPTNPCPTPVSYAAMPPRTPHTPNHCSPPHLFLPTPTPLPPLPFHLSPSTSPPQPSLVSCVRPPTPRMPPIHSSTSSPAALHATWTLCSEAPRRRASVGVYLPPIPLRHPPTNSPTPFLKTPLKDKWMPTSIRMQTTHAAPMMASASAVGCMRGAPRMAAKSDPREAGLRPCAEMCAAADEGAGCSDAEGDWCWRGRRFAVLMGAARCTRM